MKPTARGPRGRSGGFTLVELLVVLVILATILTLGIPALHNLILRSRTEGFARDLAVTMQRARLESIKKNRPAPVAVDPATKDVVAFLDADGDSAFDPDSGNPPETLDYAIARLPLPSYLAYEDPDGKTGEDSIYGASQVALGGEERKAAIFRPDGSISDPGTDPEAFAFRIADARGNQLEVRVDPPATGRIQIRKYQAPDWLSSPDPADPDYKTKQWKWN